MGQPEGARQRVGIQIIGDVPIFVADDSADVWSRPELFYLDEERNPIVIAGVPPDNFSATGQRWGNPHYRWDVMAQTGYRWWIERIRHTLTTVDIVRIDHFRGFEAAWEIPASEPTAVKGRWAKGPGAAFFQAVNAALGKLPIIAEDLGVITPEVDALRTQFGFPGMKILQFGFALDNNPKYLPHTFERDTIVYPGTHDNNTVIGWFNEAIRTGPEKWNCLRYVGADGHDLAWDFIRTAWGLGRQPGRGVPPGCDEPGQRGAHELPQQGERQLAMALHAGDADRCLRGAAARADGDLRSRAGEAASREIRSHGRRGLSSPRMRYNP